MYNVCSLFGLQPVAKCEPFTNNPDKLFHYHITMSPHTNFLVRLIHSYELLLCEVRAVIADIVTDVSISVCSVRKLHRPHMSDAFLAEYEYDFS